MIKLPTLYIYRHFKGGLYVVIGEAQHTETGEKLVLYKDCDLDQSTDKTWARPRDMFYKDQVDNPEGEGTIFRFRRVGYMKAGKPEFFIGTHDSINPLKPLM